MLARILALALAIYPALAFAQSSPILGFPPGVFQSRAAIDAGGAAPPSFATFNTTDDVANITRSNGNLTLTYTSGSSFHGVRATNSHLTGKFYFEVTPASNAGNTMVGIANANWIPENSLIFNTLDSVGYRGSGEVGTNSGSLATVQTWSLNTISVAVDLGAQLLWVRVDAGNWNNSGTANPATGVGGISISSLNAGPYFPAVTQADTGEIITANFGATAYAETVPAGFGNW
jgi:hypothetical protein